MIAENIKILRDQIAAICHKSGRNPSDIRLIAVSKNFGVEEIKLAIAAGIKDFGENKAQELVSKAGQIEEKINWHFIGQLQRNKARFAVERSDFIHSVDSLLLLSEINKRAEKEGKVQNILFEVKTSDEDSKSGIVNESEVEDLAGYCKELKNIKLIGLMTIAPYTEDKDLIRKSFRYLSKLKDKLNSLGYEITELSMGMTGDYEIAIEEGATMLRIGTAIFGERIYSNNGADQ